MQQSMPLTEANLLTIKQSLKHKEVILMRPSIEMLSMQKQEMKLSCSQRTGYGSNFTSRRDLLSSSTEMMKNDSFMSKRMDSIPEDDDLLRFTEKGDEIENEFPRHNIVYAPLVTHQACISLSRSDIDRLRQKATTLADHCRLCIFLTIFKQGGLSNKDR